MANNLRRNTQHYRHEPHNEIIGDCYRTAISCLLGLQTHEVPHFEQMRYFGQTDNINRTVRQWLAGRGYNIVNFFVPEFQGEFGDFNREWNPGTYFLLSGRSPRIDADHVVIAAQDRIVWDPAPRHFKGWGTLAGPCSNGFYQLEYIVPLIGDPIDG